MIDWNDCTPLTREEFDVFIGAAIPFLKSMEMKNGWDFFVNDLSVRWFCERFLIEAFKSQAHEPCAASGNLVMTCGLLVPRLVVLGVPVRHLGGGMIHRVRCP